MKRYESIERPGVFAYEACPNCGGQQYRNNWGESMFGLQCCGCGLLGTAGKSDDHPMLFIPNGDYQERLQQFITGAEALDFIGKYPEIFAHDLWPNQTTKPQPEKSP